MGKSLRGKECGKGICQRKDGLYYARFVWSCVILFLSTGAQESQQKTAPMIPTFISSVMRQKLNTSVCTLYAILTPRERLNAVCSRRCFKSCWVTRALKQRWTDTSMSQRKRWIKLCSNFRLTGLSAYKSTRKWRENGIKPEAPNAEALDNTGFLRRCSNI